MYSLLGLFALLAGCVAAISPLTIKGTKFFDSTGTQVYFKGTALKVNWVANGRSRVSEINASGSFYQ
jgi:hypothetical protein